MGKPECKHATCKNKYCPHCGQEISKLSPVEDLLHYVKEQVRIRAKQLRGYEARERNVKTGRKDGEYRDFYRLSREEWLASNLSNAAHSVEKAKNLLAKWQLRLETLQKLIDDSVANRLVMAAVSRGAKE